MGPFNLVWLIWALMSYLCACACPQQSTRWLFVAAACTTPILVAFVHDIVAPSFYYVTQSDDIFPCLLRAPQTWIILVIAILLWWFWKNRGDTALACDSRIPTQHSQSSTAGNSTPLLPAPHPQDRSTSSPLPGSFPQDAINPGQQPIAGSSAPSASSGGPPTGETPAAPAPSSGNGSPALPSRGAPSSPLDVPSASDGAPTGKSSASPTPATGNPTPAPPRQTTSWSHPAAPPTCSAPFGQPPKRPAHTSGTRLPKQRVKATPYLPPPTPSACNDALEDATSTLSSPPAACNDAPEDATSTLSPPLSAYDTVLIHSVTPPSLPPPSESTSSAPGCPDKPFAPTSQPSEFDGASLGNITPAEAIVKHLLSPIQDERTAHSLSSICNEKDAEENGPSSSLAKYPLLLDTTIVGTTIFTEPDFIDEMDTGDSATADQVTAGAVQWSEDGVADEPQHLSSSISDAADESRLDSFVMDLYDGEVAETDQALQFTSDRSYDPVDADMPDLGVEFNGAAPETANDIPGGHACYGDLAEPDQGGNSTDVAPNQHQPSDTVSLPDHDMDDPAADGGQTTANDGFTWNYATDVDLCMNCRTDISLDRIFDSLRLICWECAQNPHASYGSDKATTRPNGLDCPKPIGDPIEVDQSDRPLRSEQDNQCIDPALLMRDQQNASPPIYDDISRLSQGLQHTTESLVTPPTALPDWTSSPSPLEDSGYFSKSEDEGDKNYHDIEVQPYDPRKAMYTSNASPSHYCYPPSVQTPYNPAVPARQVITNVPNVPTTAFMDTLSKYAAAYQQSHGLGGVSSSLSPIKKAIAKRDRSPDPDHESEPDVSRDGGPDAGQSTTKRGRLDPAQDSDTTTTIARFARSPMYPDDTFHPLKTLSCAPAGRLIRRWCTRSIDAVGELEQFRYKGKIVDHEDLEDHISVPEQLKEFEHMPHRIKQIREYATNGRSGENAWDTMKISVVQAKKMRQEWKEIRALLEALPDLLCDISDCFDDITDELELLRSSWNNLK
ncbi:hypothetical protein LTR37_019639 [Vermiconidia calcicola]|uniref:Uncharacterized protein n=1 Tax=Vermiconidia calcicola TaxID=1690605 RepID=A0ACC3MDH3_9PEZI|nr:hypothetical protein LTR37_019639 [Vermiconidia calcicola]